MVQGNRVSCCHWLSRGQLLSYPVGLASDGRKYEDEAGWCVQYMLEKNEEMAKPLEMTKPGRVHHPLLACYPRNPALLPSLAAADGSVPCVHPRADRTTILVLLASGEGKVHSWSKISRRDRGERWPDVSVLCRVDVRQSRSHESLICCNVTWAAPVVFTRPCLTLGSTR